MDKRAANDVEARLDIPDVEERRIPCTGLEGRSKDGECTGERNALLSAELLRRPAVLNRWRWVSEVFFRQWEKTSD